MYIYLVFQSWIIACLFIFSFANPIQAESHTVLGLRIPIEKLENVDDKSVIVQIAGNQSRLIERTGLDEYVVSEGLRPDIVKNVSPQELISFIESAINSQKTSWVAHGVSVLCQASQEASSKDPILKSSLSYLTSQNFIEQLLRLIPKPEQFDEVCAAPIIIPASELKITTPVSYLYKFSSSIKSQIRQLVIDSLSHGNTEAAKSHLANLVFLYGEADSDVDLLKKAMVALQEAEHYLKEGRNTELSVRVKLLNEAGLQRAWDLILEQAAKDSINEGNSEKALKILSLQKISSAELLVSALKTLNKDNLSVFSNETTKSRIIETANDFPEFRKEISSLIESVLSAAIGSGQLLGSSEALEILSSIGSSSSDEIIYSAGLYQARQGNEQKAHNIFSLLKRPLNFNEKLKLLILTQGLTISLIIGVFGISLILYFMVRSQKLKPKNISKHHQEEDDEQERPKFVTSATWGRVQVGDPEYLELLNFFNLPIDATEKDIKNAFRKKIKEVHPDVSNNSSDEKLFIQTKDNYERLLTLLEARNVRRE